MSNLTIVVGLVGTISTVIKSLEARAVEAAAAGEEKFTGAYKLELALAVIEEVYKSLNLPVPFTTIKSTVTSTINTLVAIYNALGIFKKG